MEGSTVHVVVNALPPGVKGVTICHKSKELLLFGRLHCTSDFRFEIVYTICLIKWWLVNMGRFLFCVILTGCFDLGTQFGAAGLMPDLKLRMT